MSLISAYRSVFTACLAAFVLAPAPCAAQSEIARVRVAPLEGSTGVTLAKIIEADLSFSGALLLAPQDQEAVVISGSVTGLRLEGIMTEPSGRELMRTMYDGLDLRRAAHEFADDIVFALTGEPGIATSRIAFVSDQSGRPEIYVCEGDGREKRRVTYDGSLAAHPSLDRTGSLLTYTSYRSGFAEIFTLDLLSGKRKNALSWPGTASGAALSPDGRHLALCASSKGWPQLAVAPLGGGEPFFFPPVGRDAVPSSPAWSPDGSRLVFTCEIPDGAGPQLFEAKVGRRRATRMMLGTANAFSPDWSPNGQRLVFTTGQGGDQRLAVRDITSGQTRLLTQGREPCWGASGRHVLFSTGDRLVIVNVDNNQEKVLIENFGRLSEPSWTK